MKKLLAVSLVLSAPAFADTHAVAKRDGGGNFVLTTVRCEGGGKQAYVLLEDGRTEDGCWTADDFAVTVVWEQTGKRRYPRKHFKLTKDTVEVQRTVTVTERREW